MSDQILAQVWLGTANMGHLFVRPRAPPADGPEADNDVEMVFEEHTIRRLSIKRKRTESGNLGPKPKSADWDWSRYRSETKDLEKDPGNNMPFE